MDQSGGKGGKGGTDIRSKKEKRWEERNGAREEPHLASLHSLGPPGSPRSTPVDADLPCWDTEERLRTRPQTTLHHDPTTLNATNYFVDVR